MRGLDGMTENLYGITREIQFQVRIYEETQAHRGSMKCDWGKPKKKYKEFRVFTEDLNVPSFFL